MQNSRRVTCRSVILDFARLDRLDGRRISMIPLQNLSVATAPFHSSAMIQIKLKPGTRPAGKTTTYPHPVSILPDLQAQERRTSACPIPGTSRPEVRLPPSPTRTTPRRSSGAKPTRFRAQHACASGLSECRVHHPEIRRTDFRLSHDSIRLAGRCGTCLLEPPIWRKK